MAVLSPFFWWDTPTLSFLNWSNLSKYGLTSRHAYSVSNLVVSKEERFLRNFSLEILVEIKNWGLWSCWITSLGSGFSFSGFKISKFFEFKFFGFQKIGLKLDEFRSLAKVHNFFGKISIVQNWIWWSFNFRVFFELGFWQLLKIGVFSGSGLRK